MVLILQRESCARSITKKNAQATIEKLLEIHGFDQALLKALMKMGKLKENVRNPGSESEEESSSSESDERHGNVRNPGSESDEESSNSESSESFSDDDKRNDWTEAFHHLNNDKLAIFREVMQLLNRK